VLVGEDWSRGNGETGLLRGVAGFLPLLTLGDLLIRRADLLDEGLLRGDVRTDGGRERERRKRIRG
jgi:hypothetical protein